MTERKHTIVLLRPNKNTRTYFEYDTVSAAMDGKERAAPRRRNSPDLRTACVRPRVLSKRPDLIL